MRARVSLVVASFMVLGAVRAFAERAAPSAASAEVDGEIAAFCPYDVVLCQEARKLKDQLDPLQPERQLLTGAAAPVSVEDLTALVVEFTEISKRTTALVGKLSRKTAAEKEELAEPANYFYDALFELTQLRQRTAIFSRF